MPTIEKKQFEEAAREIFSDLNVELSNPDLADKLKANYKKNRASSYNIEAVIYCIQKFLDAEFDTGTDSLKGLGRTTKYFPRLAGYFIKSMKDMSEEKIGELYQLSAMLIIKSYIVPMLLIKAKDEEVELKSGDELYKKWIPHIYTFDPAVLGDNGYSLLVSITAKESSNIMGFIKENKMKPTLGSKTKIKLIFSKYIDAGVSLRGYEIK